MTAAVGARARRAAVVTGILAAIVAAPAIGQAAAPPSPSPSPTGTGLPVTVTLTHLAPLAPQPGQTLTLRGRLHNTSGDRVDFLAARLLLSASRVGSRGEFDAYAADPASGPPVGAVTVASADLQNSSLPSGAAEPFTISVPVDDLHLPTTSWQVYELAIVVTGTPPTGSETVGQLRTFLPWAPLGVPGVGDRTRVAWMWPLVDEPHRTTETTWRDDTLATELAAGGRLSTLLSAATTAAAQHPPIRRIPNKIRRGKHHHVKKRPPPPPRPTIRPVPVTWAIDPMLVQDATAMSAGYQVGGGSLGPQKNGAGQAAARSWLSRLRSAAPADATIALPYADPDIVGAIHAGLAPDVQIASTAGQAGQRLLTKLLGAPPLNYVWPPDGLLDQRSLDTLFTTGTTTVVLDESALPVTGGAVNETPSAHATVGVRGAGPIDALLADDTLSRAVDNGALDPTSGPLVLQRVMSELLMIQAEAPFDQRTIVVTPDRRWDPSAAFATQLLTDSGRAPWVAPVTMQQALSTPVYDKVTRSRQLVYPASEHALELDRGYLDQVQSQQQRADAFASIVPPGDVTAQGFDDGVLRLLSSAWRTDPDGAATTLRSLRRGLASTMGKVHIASHGLVTLTSHSGTIPVTVSNELDTPVRLIIAVASQHLEVSSGGQITRVIPPHRLVPVDIRATARTTGVFELVVTLHTPGTPQQRYGVPVVLTVRSTAYGAEALLITGGATAVLFVGAGVRLVRRGRAARRAAGTAA